jgi:cytoskeletal protein RodZ
MSHGTHHDEAQDKKKSIVSFQSSFWFVIILVFLFVAALNFVNAEKGGEEHGSPTEKTEVKQEAGNKSGDIEQKPTGAPQEGTSNTHAAATGTDTAAAKAH